MTIKYEQVNIRMEKCQVSVLKKQHKKFNKEHSNKLSFNAFVASFLRFPEPTNDPLSPLVPIGNTFNDNRGSITNVLNRDIRAVALITSKADTVRSNHWHRSDWHYLYVLEGSMIYDERSIDNSYRKTFKVNQGEMVFTKPGLVHRTTFLQDTTLLSLGNYINHDEDTTKENF